MIARSRETASTPPDLPLSKGGRSVNGPSIPLVLPPLAGGGLGVRVAPGGGARTGIPVAG